MKRMLLNLILIMMASGVQHYGFPASDNYTVKVKTINETIIDIWTNKKASAYVHTFYALNLDGFY